jgi:hypothetical protein
MSRALSARRWRVGALADPGWLWPTRAALAPDGETWRVVLVIDRLRQRVAETSESSCLTRLAVTRMLGLAGEGTEVRQVQPRTPLAVGLALGGLLGFAYLVYPLTLFPGLLVWWWLFSRRPRWPAISGGLMGLGAAWMFVIGRVSWVCATDPSCAQPNILPFWLAIGAVFLAAGLVVLLIGRRQPVGH